MQKIFIKHTHNDPAFYCEKQHLNKTLNDYKAGKKELFLPFEKNYWKEIKKHLLERYR
jgi:hypothetical protein